VEAAIQQVKDALEEDDLEKINEAKEALTNHFHELSAELYKDAGGDAGTEQEPDGEAAEAQDDVVDADYEVSDDEDKQEEG